jgi:hypothetical protein
MAQLTIPPFDLPAGIAPAAMLDALSKEWGYQVNVIDPQNPAGPQIPNPQTKAAYVKQYLARQFKAAYMRQTQGAAAAQAIAAITDPGDIG